MAPGITTIQQSNCGISHDLVMTGIGPLKIEADALVFDPTYVSGIGHQHRACYVEAPYKNLREDFRYLNQVTRRGAGWRNFVESADLTTMEFTVGEMTASPCKNGGRTGRRVCLADPREPLPRRPAGCRRGRYRRRLSGHSGARLRPARQPPPAAAIGVSAGRLILARLPNGARRLT